MIKFESGLCCVILQNKEVCGTEIEHHMIIVAPLIEFV